MADQNLFFLLLLLSPLLLLLFLAFIVRPRPVKIPVKGRHMFITGGSAGIGLALAQRAASEGARISILARSPEKLEEAKRAIQLLTGTDVKAFSADVRDFEAVQRAVVEAGPIDVLVVNQGVFKARELENLGVDDVKFMLDVNLMGSFNVIKAALPAMKNRVDRTPAAIALMSSQAGQIGVYGHTAYSATKFGLRGLAEALQQEVIADGIHVSVICPPDTDTLSLIEEAERRPQITNTIVRSSGLMKVDDVAKKTLNGIKSGNFIVHCNLLGFLMALATAGLSPQRSFSMAFIEVISAGIVRMGALCFQWNWYRMIEMCHITQRKQPVKCYVDDPSES